MTQTPSLFMDSRVNTQKVYIKALFHDGYDEVTEDQLINWARFLMHAITTTSTPEQTLDIIQSRVKGVRLVLVDNGTNTKDICIYKQLSLSSPGACTRANEGTFVARCFIRYAGLST